MHRPQAGKAIEKSNGQKGPITLISLRCSGKKKATSCELAAWIIGAMLRQSDVGSNQRIPSRSRLGHTHRAMVRGRADRQAVRLAMMHSGRNCR